MPVRISSKGSKKKYVKRKTIGTMKVGDFHRFVTNDPFPPRRNYKLTYTAEIPLASDGIHLFGAEWVFRLNDIYDPFIGTTAGVDHQPYGYDEVSAIYRRFKVNGCMVRITFTDPEGGSNPDATVVGALISNPASVTQLTGLTVGKAKEKIMCKTKSLVDSGNQKAVIQQYVPMHQGFGWTKKQYSNDMNNTTGNFSGGPGSAVLLRLAICNVRDSASNCRATVELTYYTSCYERITLTQS